MAKDELRITDRAVVEVFRAKSNGYSTEPDERHQSDAPPLGILIVVLRDDR